MRVLKYAILGLLNRHPMTGYDIAKDFKHELAEFWHANHSQIYTELKKLFDEQLVTFDIEISGEVLEKKQYSITEAGKEQLLNWLHQDELMSKTAKDPFRVRMYFCNFLTLDTRIALLNHQKELHEAKLSKLKKTALQYPTVPQVDSDRFGDFIILEGAIIREKGYIEWCTRCINYCISAQKSE